MRKKYEFFYLNKSAQKCLGLFMRYEMCCIQTSRHSDKTVLFFVLIDNTTFLHIVYRSQHLVCTYPFIFSYTWHIIHFQANQKLQTPRCKPASLKCLPSGIISLSFNLPYCHVIFITRLTNVYFICTKKKRKL